MNDISIEEKFCESLKKFIETQHPSEIKGYISKLAKTLDVSQGYLSNVLAGRRPGSETWRRSVAKKLNLDYEIMIGIKPIEPTFIESNNHIIKFPNNNGPPASAEELIRTDMHQRLDEILHSGHVVLISAIQSNLVAFSESVKDKKDKQDMLDRIKILEGKSG